MVLGRTTAANQLLLTQADFVDAHDNNECTHVLALDMAKAFDKVPHGKLILKLKKFNLDPCTIRWIVEWLKGRRFSVTVNGARSRLEEVQSGVPQGSVLGPLLFILYITDLPQVVQNSTIRLFADDALLYRRVESRRDANFLRADLKRIEEWADTWQLVFNPSKCETCVLGRKGQGSHQYPPRYRIKDTRITEVNAFVYLGVTFSRDLSLNAHVEKAVAKANSLMGMLFRNLSGCSANTKRQAYMTICRPTLEYASSVWSPSSKKLIRKLEMVNRRAFRWTHLITRSEPITDLMEQRHWSTLEERRKKKDQSIVVKANLGQLNIDLADHVKGNTFYNTRIGILRQWCNTDTKRNSFFSRIAT